MNTLGGSKKQTSRQKKAADTKEKLFKSAMSLFKEKGYYNVSVDEIVYKAGTSKGSFYTHFSSKDQVIIEHCKNYDRHYIEFYRDMKILKTSREKLINFVKSLYTFANETAGFDITYVLYDTQLSHSCEKAFINDENRPLYKILNEIIHTGQKKGEFITDLSIRELVKMVTRTMRGTFYDWCLHDGNFDLIEDGVKYFSIFVDGIMKKHSET